MINLWLDDNRPAPIGWIHAKTDSEARTILENNLVNEMSFDHDLGACVDCKKEMKALTDEEWLIKTNYKTMPNCPHFGSGYTLVCWMEENNIWPKWKPTVHSMNPVGKAKIQTVLDRHYDIMESKLI